MISATRSRPAKIVASCAPSTRVAPNGPRRQGQTSGVCSAESLPPRWVALACLAPASVSPIHPGVCLWLTIRLPVFEQAVQIHNPYDPLHPLRAHQYERAGAWTPLTLRAGSTSEPPARRLYPLPVGSCAARGQGGIGFAPFVSRPPRGTRGSLTTSPRTPSGSACTRAIPHARGEGSRERPDGE